MTMSSQQYVYYGGLKCPDCGSDEVEGDGGVEVEGGSAYQDVHCTECGAGWRDLYQLTGFENLVPGEG